jgi:Tfp pilus assembly protein PilF
VGEYDDAEVSLKGALKARPEYAEAHKALSVAYGMSGQTEEAKFHSQEAARVNPEFGA